MSTPRDSALSAPRPRHQSTSESAPDAAHILSVPDPDNPPWSLLEALLTWAVSMILSLVVPPLIALPYLSSHYPDVRPTTEILRADKTLIIIFIAGLLPVHGLTLLLAWAVVSRLGRVPFGKALGWSWKSDFGLGKSVGLATLLFLAAWLILIKFGGQDTELERILESSRAAALITATLAFATAPLVEEVIYRGVLYSAFQRAIGLVPAIVVVASMFAGLHVWQYWPNAGAISAIALLSVALTIVRARTGRLLPCFVIHLVFNGIQSLIIILEPYLRTLIESWQHRPAGPGLVNFLLGITR